MEKGTIVEKGGIPILVTMKRQLFESLDDEALGWACIEPTIQKIRGKDPTVKSQVYAQLTPGQRALQMFWVLYGHAHSVAEFYWFVSYFISELKAWSEIKVGIRYFGDDSMLRIYEELEEILEARNRQIGADWRNVSVRDLDDDSDLLASVGQLYARYHETVPETLKRISAYIRNNPNEFVQIED